MNTTRRFPELELNTSAKIVTVLFAFSLAVIAYTVYYYGILFSVTTLAMPLAGSVANLAYALVGLNAARMFGGRHNFTGRLLIFYSIALILGALTWILWGVFAGGELPPFGTKVEPLLAGTIVGHAVAGFALFTSARALLVKLTRMQLAMVAAALALSLGLSLATSLYMTSLLSQIVWGGVWSAVTFLQLASALVLISLLGGWYITRPLAGIAFGYLSFNIAVSIVIIVNLPTSYPNPGLWLTLFLIAGITNYIVGMSMSQVRPMKQDVLKPIRAANIEPLKT